MKRRCYEEKNESYPRYGGRGITICKEWLDDFMSFYNWSMENGYSDKLSIDRIDNDGNYEPNNCRWATNSVQSRNQSNTIIVEIFGVKKSLLNGMKLLEFPTIGHIKDTKEELNYLANRN